MQHTNHHFRPRNAHSEWLALVAHLRQHPDDLQIALENIERWLAWGRTHPGPLRAWRGRIQSALESPANWESFLDWLACDNGDAEPLKGCSPFVGILPHAASP